MHFLFLTVSPHSHFFCESTTFIPLMSLFLLVKQNPWYRARESSPLTLKCTWTYHQRERPQLHPHAHANTRARARTGRQIERADMTFVICSEVFSAFLGEVASTTHAGLSWQYFCHPHHKKAKQCCFFCVTRKCLHHRKRDVATTWAKWSEDKSVGCRVERVLRVETASETEWWDRIAAKSVY